MCLMRSIIMNEVNFFSLFVFLLSFKIFLFEIHFGETDDEIQKTKKKNSRIGKIKFDILFCYDIL